MDVLLLRALGLLALAILVAIAARRLRQPYTVGLVLAGAALAATRFHAGLALTHDLIFDVVLPPLLFEAALNLRWRDFSGDLVPVLTLATVGVVLCAAVVAGGLHYWLGWPIESALVFGALIAATDPIAVIALLRESGVTGRLRLLIEAESLLNDGAATVLFTLILAFAAHDPQQIGAWSVAGTFVRIAGGGLLVGVIVGVVAVVVAGTSDDHLIETALTATAAFGSFVIAEHFQASGVLATVAAGITMGNLGVLGPREGFGALTAQGRAFVLEFWEFAAFLANSLVFLLIGSAMATIDFGREGWRALALAILLALVGRAVAVYPICLAFSRSRWAAPLNRAASPVVGRLTRGARPGAGVGAAGGPALSRGHPHRRLRRRRLLDHRPGPDRAVGAALARLVPKPPGKL